jgi:hypothetical protein
MFDNFAGDLLDTDDDADDEEQARFVPLYRDERVAGSTERSPLLQRKSSHMADLGTVTETKAVSLLLKAFVGSGVLFLPAHSLMVIGCSPLSQCALSAVYPSFPSYC